MDRDLLAFFAGIAVLILYLIFSAMTEMGTKWPGRGKREEGRGKREEGRGKLTTDH